MAIRTINSSKTFSSGGFTVNVRAQSLNVELDPMVLAAGAAAAIGAAIGAGIRAISDEIAPATRVYRAKARKAYERGAAWAMARYSSPPGTGDTLFNDSGELAAGVQVDAGNGSYEVSLPGDRLQAAGGGDLAERLAELVPAIDDPFDDPGVEAAVEDSADAMITVG